MATGRSARAATTGVLGYVGGPFPSEIALAFGLSPKLLSVDPKPSSDAPSEEFLDDKEDAEIRSVFGRAMLGELAVDALVVTRRHDHLYYFLKECQRLGAAPELPPFHILDIMQMQTGVAEDYNAFGLNALAAFLARTTGRALDGGRLAEAVHLGNLRRTALLNLEDLRRSGEVSGAAAFAMIAEGLTTDPVAHTAALQAFCASPPKGAVTPRVLLVTSHALGDARLHEAVEAAGVTVVAEEDGSGRHNPMGLIPESGDPLAEVARFYAENCPSVVAYPRAARDAYIRRRLGEGGIAAVVFCITPTDQLFGWDYPALKASLDAEGLPSLRVLADPGQPQECDAIRAAVAGFVAEHLAVPSR